ncbi:MAG: hypothetical protein AAGC55_34055, partial [Myxococcota bacterium]
VNREAQKTEAVIVLRRIDAAYRQVVAGINYKLRIDVETNGKPRTAELVVYRDLQGVMTLTSWTWQ